MKVTRKQANRQKWRVKGLEKITIRRRDTFPFVCINADPSILVVRKLKNCWTKKYVKEAHKYMREVPRSMRK